MEPTPTKVVYVIKTQVNDVEQRFARFHVAGHGPDSIFKTKPIGWFVHFYGSHEALYMGEDKPPLNAGDNIEIRIRKLEYATTVNTSEQ